MDGLLYVDKPVGITSHDVVGVVRRAARSRRVGHAGTLDPFATGLLVLGIGNCTRLLPYIVGEPKVYDAVIRFGSETDTDDATGRMTIRRPLPALDDDSGHALLGAAIATLTGRIAQSPPAYSAKHVDGERAYALARRGEAVELPPVDITVHTWEVIEVSSQCLRARITCGGGTYVRALARDLGRALASAAHCEQLRRIASGAAHVDTATPFTALTPGAIVDGTVALHSPLAALGDIATESLDDVGVRALAQGRAIAATKPGPIVAFLAGPRAPDARVLGIGVRTTGERWQPRVVLLGTEA